VKKSQETGNKKDNLAGQKTRVIVVQFPRILRSKQFKGESVKVNMTIVLKRSDLHNAPNLLLAKFKNIWAHDALFINKLFFNKIRTCRTSRQSEIRSFNTNKCAKIYLHNANRLVNHILPSGIRNMKRQILEDICIQEVIHRQNPDHRWR
jgi:hypothetical protein